MRVIEVTFERFSDVTMDRLPGALGVYVIWSSKSRVKPAYIGEGEILSRFEYWARNLPLPLRGFVAILSYGSQREVKADAEIVEALLLNIADEINRWPTNNEKSGKRSNIEKIFKRHGVLRVNITGYDPLLAPNLSRMKGKKIITVQIDKEGIIEINHRHWKRRYI